MAEFGTQKELLLRYQIVLCITDDATSQEQLPYQSALSLHQAVEIFRTRESAKKLAFPMQVAASDHQVEVDAINARKPGSRFKKQPGCNQPGNLHVVTVSANILKENV